MHQVRAVLEVLAPTLISLPANILERRDIRFQTFLLSLLDTKLLVNVSYLVFLEKLLKLA